LNAQLYACESACIYKWTKACVVPAGRVGYCAISHIYLDVVNYAWSHIYPESFKKQSCDHVIFNKVTPTCKWHTRCPCSPFTMKSPIWTNENQYKL